MLRLLCVKGSRRYTLYRVYIPVVPETRGPTDMGPFYMSDDYGNRQVVFYDEYYGLWINSSERENHSLWVSSGAEFVEVPE